MSSRFMHLPACANTKWSASLTCKILTGRACHLHARSGRCLFSGPVGVCCALAMQVQMPWCGLQDAVLQPVWRPVQCLPCGHGVYVSALVLPFFSGYAVLI